MINDFLYAAIIGWLILFLFWSLILAFIFIRKPPKSQLTIKLTFQSLIIFGVVFVDIGVVWNDDFKKYSDESNWDTSLNLSVNGIDECGVMNGKNECLGWLMSYDFGPRFIFLGMPWKLDYAWQYNPHKGKISSRKWYISIGFDF